MGPSKQVNRRTNKKDLGKRIDGVAKQGLESHNQQVLWEACTTRYLVTWNLADYNAVLFGS